MPPKWFPSSTTSADASLTSPLYSIHRFPPRSLNHVSRFLGGLIQPRKILVVCRTDPSASTYRPHGRPTGGFIRAGTEEFRRKRPLSSSPLRRWCCPTFPIWEWRPEHRPESRRSHSALYRGTPCWNSMSGPGSLPSITSCNTFAAPTPEPTALFVRRPAFRLQHFDEWRM